MRIGGIASGIDTEQIVKDLMKVQQTKMDRLEQDKLLLTWKQEKYNDINKELANFILDTKKELGLASTSSTGLYLNNSVSSLDWVKKATASNTDYANISARADAVEGTYNVKVGQLATSAQVASNKDLGELKSLKVQFGLFDSDVIEFKIDGVGKDGKPTTQTFKYSGDQLNNLSIRDITNDINSKDLGVKAIYDPNINRFFLQSTSTGQDNGFTVTKGTGEIGENVVNFMTGVDNKLGLALESGTKKEGTDAKINFAGAVGIKQSSNQFVINGINFDLKATGDFTIKVATDIDGVYEKISDFVTKYNDLVGKLNDTMGEKRYRDFLPLTNDQKKNMSEKEIEQWEEKARSGLIKEDSNITRTLQSMRSGLYEEVKGTSGVFDQLTKMGIATDNYFTGKTGALVINETKLKTAIRDNVDGVLELLFKEPSSDLRIKAESQMTAGEVAEKRSQSGLIRRLYDNMVVGMKGLVTKAGPGENANLYRNVNSSIMIDFVSQNSSISLLDKDATDLNKRIARMGDYLLRTEDRYWQQFTAMEKALQRMQSQSDWMMQQFGGN